MKPFSEQQETWNDTNVENAFDVIQIGPMTIKHDQESLTLLRQMVPFLQQALDRLEKEHRKDPLPEKETIVPPVLRDNPFVNPNP